MPRSTVGAFLAIVGAASLGPVSAQTGGPVPEAVLRANLYQIEARNCAVGGPRYGTGFHVKSVGGQGPGIVTALHVVVGCEIFARPAQPGRLVSGLSILYYDREHDAVLLAPPTQGDAGLTTGKLSEAGLMNLWLAGYPETVTTPRNRRVQYLKRVVDDPCPPALETLASFGLNRIMFERRRSPALGICVLNITAGPRPGDSGAPIIDELGHVIAIANGGLKGGDANLNWAVAIQELNWRYLTANPTALDELKRLDPREVFKEASSTYVKGIEYVRVTPNDPADAPW